MWRAHKVIIILLNIFRTIFAQKYYIFYSYNKFLYSQTFVQRPPSGSRNSGHKWPLLIGSRGSEVIFVIKFEMGPHNGGRWRQRVAMRRWSLAQVWLYIKWRVRNEKNQAEFKIYLPIPSSHLILMGILITKAYLQLSQIILPSVCYIIWCDPDIWLTIRAIVE
jgi:hypothetical protein